MEKRKYIIIGIIFVIILLVVPYIVLSFFSLPYSDDFLTAADMHNNFTNSNSYLGKALKTTYEYYKNWGGFYFATFINIYLSPFARWGLNGMRAVIAFFQILHYIALYVLLRETLYTLFHDKKLEHLLPLYAMIVFVYGNFDIQNEVLTWYTGVVAYVFVITCMLFGAALCFRGIRTQKKVYFWLATFLFFLTGGGALNVVVLNCGVAILITIFGIGVYKSKECWKIAAGAVTGGIINAMAPGNFVRHSSIADQFYIGAAMKSTLYHVWTRQQELWFTTPWALILLICFLLALYIIKPSERFQYRAPLLIVILYLIACVMVDFPVWLGYGKWYPGRCAWVENCCIYLGAFVTVFYLAGWVKSSKGDAFILKKETIWCLSVSGVLFLCALGGNKTLDDYPTVQLIKQLTGGELEEYASFWEDILSEIENSQDDDVEVERIRQEKNQFIKDPDIYGTKEDYTNATVAAYYNKNSVIINYRSE